MQKYQKISYICIKPDALSLVKHTLGRFGALRLFLFFIITFFSINYSTADDQLLELSLPPVRDELPPIEAQTFHLKVIKRSASDKIYLFEDLDTQVPTTGRILLLKAENESFMALRILKTDLNNKTVIAKRIKRYNNHYYLENDTVFIAIEKISDRAISSLESQEDHVELEDFLHKTSGLRIQPYDPELDLPSSPQPSNDGEDTPLSQKDLEARDSHLTVSLEEIQPIETQQHWLTAGFGYVRNNGPSGSYYFSAGNLRVATNLGKMLFLNSPHLQDSLSIEAGFYLYKALNFSTLGDAYTILNLVANFRYNLFFNQSFGLFFYGGIMQGYVLSASQTNSTSLNSFSVAGGGGLLFQVGPSWYTRIDIGYDNIGLNLVLRF